MDPPTPGKEDYVNKIVFHAGLPGTSVPGLLRFIADLADAVGEDVAVLTPVEIADLVPADATEGVLGGNWLRVLRESLPA